MKWWCHSMENFSAFWSLCAVSDAFSSQRHGDANLYGFRCRKAWSKAAFHTLYVFRSTFYVFLRLDLFWCIWLRYTSHLQRSTFVKHAHIYVTMKLHMQYFHSFTQLVRMCSNPNSSKYNHIQFTALFSNNFFCSPLYLCYSRDYISPGYITSMICTVFHRWKYLSVQCKGDRLTLLKLAPHFFFTYVLCTTDDGKAS